MFFHIFQFNLGSFYVGLLLLFAPGSYALACPLWGYLGDKMVGYCNCCKSNTFQLSLIKSPVIMFSECIVSSYMSR